ncbi:hypothetical protein C8R47DRAFT_1079299 [Mycena vitilis]|nr:hypothetical protein C8R47DRAFT_1079299 [Mycena vitilis]
MLPTLEDWAEATLWFPAEFLNFDAAPRIHVRMDAGHRFAGESVERRHLLQCRLLTGNLSAHFRDSLNLNFAQVPEDAPVLDDELARLFYLAVPTIAEILDRMDMSNPVIRSREDFFKDEPYTLKKSVVWMRSCGFDPTPALESMLEEPLAALRAHPLMRADSDDSHRMVWGPGSVFLQVLAIQHSNGEPWDLNGQTFCDVRAGRLVFSPPRALEGLTTMWLSIDPVDVATENHWSFPEVSRYEAEFRPCDVVFYQRLQASPPTTTPPVRIQHNGQNILTAAGLPPDNRPPKRELRDVEDIADVAPVKRLRGAKYKPKPTPPGVRRSQRMINKKK